MDGSRSGVTVEAIEEDTDILGVRTQFDIEETPASMAVIATLEEVMDTDPGELTPLYSTVDTDALDSLLRVRNGTAGDIHISFTHEDHEITVSSYGVVTISEEPAPTTGNLEGDVGI
jgi:hypothetical protein